MSTAAWTVSNWESFEAHAAPEAIEHQLSRVKALRRAAQRDVERLAELAGRRAAQIEAGTWPPKTTEHQCVSPAACWAAPDCPVYSSRSGRLASGTEAP